MVGRAATTSNSFSRQTKWKLESGANEKELCIDGGYAKVEWRADKYHTTPSAENFQASQQEITFLEI